ncbi:MAG: response regulator transcription factor [bacterium]
MGKHILLIDDQENLRSLLAQALRSNGYLVTTAVDGQAGLALFNENKDKIDLVLTDVNMPGIDGFQVLTQIKASNPKEPVILLTGTNQEMADYVGTELKADGVLYKPYKVDEVLATIKKLLNQ